MPGVLARAHLPEYVLNPKSSSTARGFHIVPWRARALGVACIEIPRLFLREWSYRKTEQDDKTLWAIGYPRHFQ